MKKILFLALVATTIFSCSKEKEGATDSGDTKTVRLTIKSSDTKAAEEAGSVHKTPISDFTVYFINSTGGVVETRSATDTQGSYVFKGVSGLASKIYIVANTTLTSTTLTGSTLADLQANVLEIANYQKGIDNVIMAASGATILAAGGVAGEYTATVTIAPVVARLEIAKLTAIPVEGGDTNLDITEFIVANIYVNNYDPKMTLAGVASGRETGTTANFATTDLKDLAINITSAGKVAVPATPNNVWAYQLFPGGAPTMVIQFSSITFANGDVLTDINTDPKDLCITVTTFNPATFVAAKIYNVANIPFSSKNIGKPYEATKNITVTLNVTDWAIEATTVTLQ